MKINAVIFDLDGTLLNTLDDLTAAVNHALGAFGMGGVEIDRVRKYVGNGVPLLIERALYFAATGRDPDSDECVIEDRSLFRACLAVFTEYYNEHSADRTAPYAGVPQMLEGLAGAGVKTAIVTNKYEGAAKELKNKFFGGVNAIVGAREGIRPKPATDGVYKALELLGTDKNKAVYVGDGETDMQTAKNCGMPVVAVTWGFRDADVLMRFEPDFLINKPSELVKVLRGAGLI